jgi:hypothetical protein
MYKALIGCSVAAAAMLFFGALQSGVFGPNRVRVRADEKPEAKTETAKKAAIVRARFPEDLAPAARAQPVAAAADFKVGVGRHKLVFLKPNGFPHKWQEDAVGYSEEWLATNVEETELVVVVTPQKQTRIERATFVNGPPIERFRFELEASVIEAKTGKVLAHRSFVNMPRPIERQELYEVTGLGSPVRYLTVFGWLAGQAQGGFSATINATPHVTVVERQ